MPVNAAVVVQNIEQRVAAFQIVSHQRVTPQFKRLAVFTQHVQTGGVVNLRVHQKNGADGGVSQRARRLQCRKASNLLQDVGGGIEQDPILGVAADGNGRLSACDEAWIALTPGIAIRTVAVPLRKSAAGRRA